MSDTINMLMWTILFIALIFEAIAMRAFFKDVMNILASIQYKLNSLDTMERNEAEGMYHDEPYVTCGGCGMTVYASNGFTPDEHGCDALRAS